MIKNSNLRTKTLRKIFFGLVFVQLFSFSVAAQVKEAKSLAEMPKVTQVNDVALKNILKPNGKPLLVNFWATWCEPCREEFPDLIKISAEYKGKLDFITVSLDDVEEIGSGVPKFLAEMKAEMPSFLLKTTNEDAVISSVSKNWQGSLPFTILYDAGGNVVYSTALKVKPDLLRSEIEKSFAAEVKEQTTVNLPVVRLDKFSYKKGISDAKKDVKNGQLIFQRFGLTAAIPQQTEIREKYGIEFTEHGCAVTPDFLEYVRGYNETSTAAMKVIFGSDILTFIGVE